MKKLLEIYLFSILMVFWAVGSVFAISLGTNITIPDGVSSDTSGWWGNHEDQEVEPYCVVGQLWDLEGFFLDGTTLTMVGGFDFENGEEGYQSGDIFIDTDGNPDYEYALSLDFSNLSDLQYTVYSLGSSPTMRPVYYSQNNGSNPWRYDHVADSNNGLGTGGFTYYAGLSDSEVGGLVGDTHNAVAIDLGYLIDLGANLNDFIVHNTMECGNDNLMGNGSVPVPEPATVMLVGTGLLGMIAFGRKRFNKKT